MCNLYFYPRSPCGERLCCGCFVRFRYWISIHALLAESDSPCCRWFEVIHYFYPRSPCGERQVAKRTTDIRPRFLSTLSLRRATSVGFCLDAKAEFLSTLSLRRATVAPVLAVGREGYFYPRSPCGERPRTGSTCGGGQNISIHALLAESDQLPKQIRERKERFLSTLSLRRATAGVPAHCKAISYFYPRSPCGERPS